MSLGHLACQRDGHPNSPPRSPRNAMQHDRRNVSYAWWFCGATASHVTGWEAKPAPHRAPRLIREDAGQTTTYSDHPGVP